MGGNKSLLLAYIIFFFLIVIFFSQYVFASKNLEENPSLTVMKRSVYSNTYYDEESRQYILEISPEPINYDSGAGVFPIDQNIRDGNSCEMDYCANKGIYGAEFRRLSGSDKAVTFNYDSDKINYNIGSLEYIKGSRSQHILDNQNVTGYANGSTFVYPNIYGKGIDLKYKYENTLLKEELVVDSFSSLPALSLDEDGSYLKLNFGIEATTKKEDKGIQKEEDLKFFDQEKGKRWWQIFKFDIENPISFKDSSDDKGFILPKAYAYDNAGNNVPIIYRLEKDKGNVFVSLLVPYGWLKNAQYPIRVDPGIEVTVNGYGIIKKRNFDDVNGERYDELTNLDEIDSYYFGGGEGKITRGWSLFNISSIPDDANVNNVKLEFWVSDVELNDCPLSPNTEKIIVSNLDEDSIDITPDNENEQEDLWVALGSGTYYSEVSFTTEGAQGWQGLDLGNSAVTEAQSLINNPTTRFTTSYKGWDEDINSDMCWFDISTDSSTKPRLTVYYSINDTNILNWPQCNPADPCCDPSGNFRSNGFVCKSAHNATCTSANSSTCGGQAYENRCTGTSSLCPVTEYQISYPAACDNQVCVGQSCSGSTLQPQRTCSAGVCQRNDQFECPNNLICGNATACKLFATSNSDCKTSFLFNNTLNVCYAQPEGGEIASDYIYDANGNLISGDGNNYAYNDLNQLVGLTFNGQVLANYTYDDQGNRIKKVVYATNTTIYYLDNFVQIVNSSGTFNETYYYYYGNLFAKKNNSDALTIYGTDLLGSPSVSTLSNGSVYDIGLAEPFGDPISTGERYAFTGYEADLEADLLYAKARYYDPTKGQFIQPDSIIGDIYNPQDLNKYTYVRNNPYTDKDPSGKCPQCVVGVLGAIATVDYGYKLFSGEIPVPHSLKEFYNSFTFNSGQAIGKALENPAEVGLAVGTGSTLEEIFGSGKKAIKTVGGTFSVSDEGATAFRTVFKEVDRNIFSSTTKSSTLEYVRGGNLPSDVEKSANNFFKGATQKSNKFNIIKSDSGYRFEFFSPAETADYGKLYTAETDSAGQIIDRARYTIGPGGSTLYTTFY